MLNWVDRVLSEWTPSQPLVLLFDYDGTLAPLAKHPRLAYMPTVAREALTTLAGAANVTVGVISGRAIADLKHSVRIPSIWYAGSNGMHVDIECDERIDPAIEEFQASVDLLLASLAGPVQWFAGTWIERKPGCLTLHYRSLLPLMATCFVEEVRDTLNGLIGPECPPLRVREVSRAIEIALADSWTKGDAAGWMLTRRRHDALAVFVCDGANDEEAVAIVNARGGVTIGVGPDAPNDVVFRLASPRDLAEDLVRLAREVNPGDQPVAAFASDLHAAL
jgi:trehalose 6-phosphate phosphatase